jgi:hypothetical protein
MTTRAQSRRLAKANHGSPLLPHAWRSARVAPATPEPPSPNFRAQLLELAHQVECLRPGDILVFIEQRQTIVRALRRLATGTPPKREDRVRAWRSDNTR